MLYSSNKSFCLGLVQTITLVSSKLLRLDGFTCGETLHSLEVSATMTKLFFYDQTS